MSSGTASGKLYLVDAHSLIFQVFHAIRGMTSPSGVPTNALFGFVRDLLFLRGLEPDYLVCAFDRPEPTFRSVIYPDYKAHREAMPDDLEMQIPLTVARWKPWPCPPSASSGTRPTISSPPSPKLVPREVWMFTYAQQIRTAGSSSTTVSGSTTCREEFGRAELLADWGIEPSQVVDLQSLVGDSVDNVPGVPGIGIKTAAKLLQEFGTLENVLSSVNRISGAKRQENLRAAGPIVELSRQLVRLAVDVPLAIDWEAWRLKPIHTEQMLALCREWGFQNLAGQIRTLGKQSAHSATAVAATQRNLFPTKGDEMFPFGANAVVADAVAGVGSRVRQNAGDVRNP